MSRRLHSLYARTEILKGWLASRFTPLGRSFLLLTGAAFIFGINVERTMIYQIFILASFLLVISYLFSLRFSPSLTISRKLPSTCVAGRRLTYRIRIENTGSRKMNGVYFREGVVMELPSPSEFDVAREEGEERRNFFDRKMGYYRWLWLLGLNRRAEAKENSLPAVQPGAVREMEVSLLPLRRGFLHLAPAVLSRRDPLGLCKREARQGDRHTLLVLPRMYQVPPFFFTGSRKYHRGGIMSARGQGDSSEFLALREYVPGDSIRHMDWKATARSGKGIVRQFRQEYFSRHALVLDNYTDTPHSEILEEAVSLAASVMVAQRQADGAVDQLLFENRCIAGIIGSAVEGRRRMLATLASLSTRIDGSFAELAALVRNRASRLSGVIIILIQWDSERKKLLEYLQFSGVACKTILIVGKNDQENARRAEASSFGVQVVEVGQVEQQLEGL